MTAQVIQRIAARRTWPCAMQAWFSVTEAEVEPHPEGDQQEAEALVGAVLAEGDVHAFRPGDQDHDGDQRGEADDPHQHHFHRVAEFRGGVGIVGGVEAGEVGEDRGRDRLEELQTAPGASIRMLKMIPASVAPWRPRMISGPALRKACSENMIRKTRRREPAAVFEREAGRVLRFVRAAAGVVSATGAAAAALCFCALWAKANGTTSRLRAGAAVIPIATAPWPLSTLKATSTAKIVRKHDSERIKRDEEAEFLFAGEEAAGEVARRVEEDRGEEDPVEGFVALQQAVLDRPAQRQRQHREEQREAELDRRGDPHRLAQRLAFRHPLGDVAAEQLFDRPVEAEIVMKTADHSTVDLPVVGLREGVGGDQVGGGGK